MFDVLPHAHTHTHIHTHYAGICLILSRKTIHVRERERERERERAPTHTPPLPSLLQAVVYKQSVIQNTTSDSSVDMQKTCSSFQSVHRVLKWQAGRAGRHDSIGSTLFRSLLLCLTSHTTERSSGKCGGDNSPDKIYDTSFLCEKGAKSTDTIFPYTLPFCKPVRNISPRSHNIYWDKNMRDRVIV